MLTEPKQSKLRWVGGLNKAIKPHTVGVARVFIGNEVSSSK